MGGEGGREGMICGLWRLCASHYRISYNQECRIGERKREQAEAEEEEEGEAYRVTHTFVCA